ncbi:uncharacterized protein LOC100368269 [Saccoglossus kowalevskii]|uniref:Matrilin-2-like n=1 Tax=Saccoglossus kowalevskii TaxID=10224 RepID=A0ABM0M4E2_SACKO|nr:PREDICTED: matrilin-2-like [Saccoglossus kowalevskii]
MIQLFIYCMVIFQLQTCHALPCSLPNSCDSSHGLCELVAGNEVCSCLAGFTLDTDEVTCNDVDECELGTHGCEQGCTNTIGGADCYCFEGYEILSSRLPHLCKDVDECLINNGGCEQVCTNSDGSFTCSCDVGYELWVDGVQCDINECQTNNGGCEQLCWNIINGFYCDCNSGFVLNPDGFTCESVGSSTTPTSVSRCKKYLVNQQDGITLDDANLGCEANGGVLLKIPSESSANFINTFIVNTYIGLDLDMFWYEPRCPDAIDNTNNDKRDGYICKLVA